MRLLSTLFNVLYWVIAYPLLVLIYWAFTLLYWIASPFIYLGDFIIQAGLIPFRFLAKLEVRPTFQKAFSIANIHMSDTLYLLRRRNHCRTDDRPDPPFLNHD
jgi:hypothetical protein